MTPVTPPTGSLTFIFNGVQVEAQIGQTVGAALLQDGTRVLRQTRFEIKPRGMFCGIGICFDCLVQIDGQPNQRACLVEAKEGMQVESPTDRGGAA